MVSQWCDNGTVSRYLKNYPDADRLMLVSKKIVSVYHMFQFTVP